MLRVVVHKSGDTVVLHCQGRILGGDVTLRRTAESQQDASLLLLDLAQVHGIDAGGLGVLLKLRQWAHTNGIELRLMNVTGIVRQVLEVRISTEFLRSAALRTGLAYWVVRRSRCSMSISPIEMSTGIRAGVRRIHEADRLHGNLLKCPSGNVDFLILASS